MGTCMTSDHKSDKKTLDSQLSSKKCSVYSPDSLKETCDHSSPPSDRLDKVKAKLPPLKKGIEKRQKIISMCEESSRMVSKTKKNEKSVKSEGNKENDILNYKLKQQIPLTKS